MDKYTEAQRRDFLWNDQICHINSVPNSDYIQYLTYAQIFPVEVVYYVCPVFPVMLWNFEHIKELTLHWKINYDYYIKHFSHLYVYLFNI